MSINLKGPNNGCLEGNIIIIIIIILLSVHSEEHIGLHYLV